MYFFFNDTATTEIYTLSLHDALPIYPIGGSLMLRARAHHVFVILRHAAARGEHSRVLAAQRVLRGEAIALGGGQLGQLALLLGDEFRRQHQRRQIGLGEVAIVVAFLLGALRTHRTLARV